MPVQRIPRALRGPTIRLKDHSYWNRAWVIQELALARSLRILCGLSETTLDKLETYSRAGSFTNGVSPSSLCVVIYFLAGFCDLLIKAVPFTIRIALRKPAASDVKQLFEFVHKTPGIVVNKPPFSFWSLLERQSLCRDPRDRLYSIFAITDNVTGFQVNYDETILQTFWRTAEHFEAWHDFNRLHTLRIALSLDVEIDVARLELTPNTAMLCSIAMRPCRLLTHYSKGYGHKFCEVETFITHDVAIRGCKSDELLLCPYLNKRVHGFHLNTNHFALSPQSSTSQGFTISAYQPFAHHSIPLSDHSELWSFENGASARVVHWKEVLRIAALGGGADQRWKSKPHFILKTDQHDVLSLVGQEMGSTRNV